MDLVSQYFRPLANTSLREMLIMLRSPAITGQRDYIWMGTCTGANRKLRLKIVYAEMLQYVFVVKYFIW